MSTYVMVHGAWHGAWCWYKVVPLLQRAGHIVVAPDLPSLGRDRTPLCQVSLATWVDHICHIVDTVSEPVVLVGHSRAGIIISEVAERRPKKIAVLVYLAAYLLRDGESLLPVAQRDGTSLVLPNLVVSEDQTSSTIKPQAIREVFYADCSDEDVALAGMLLAPEALAPAVTPVHVTEEGFGRVPRVYIECLLDKVIPPPLQRQMLRETAVPKGRLHEHRSFAVLFSFTEAHGYFDCARCRWRRLTRRPPASQRISATASFSIRSDAHRLRAESLIRIVRPNESIVCVLNPTTD